MTVAEARALARRLLVDAGLPELEAQTTADAIVLADAWGIESHGLIRLPFYIERLRAGGYSTRQPLRTVIDTGPVVALDGQGGLGHWQLARASELASQRCSEHGVAAVSVGNSGHCGALGVYVQCAIDHDQIALVFSTGPAVMAPWGGTTAVLSTSPFAAGIPTRPRPTIIDLASSAVARGKIAAYAQSRQALPDGWALGADGQPTNDAQSALRGLLAPVGGAKGYAIALLVEGLTGGMVGPRVASQVTDMFTPAQDASPQAIGHLIITLDPARLSVDGAENARRRLDTIAAQINASGARLPGAFRHRLSEIDPDQPLHISARVEADIRRRVARLDAAAREG